MLEDFRYAFVIKAPALQMRQNATSILLFCREALHMRMSCQVSTPRRIVSSCMVHGKGSLAVFLGATERIYLRVDSRCWDL